MLQSSTSSFRYFQQPSDALGLAESVLRDGGKIESEEGLRQWVLGPLRDLVPLDAAVICYGFTRYDGLSLARALSIGVPESFTNALDSSKDPWISPAIHRWVKTGNPEYFRAVDFCPVRDEKCVRNFQVHGLTNGIVDGRVDAKTGKFCIVLLLNLAGDGSAATNIVRDFCTTVVADALSRIHNRPTGPEKTQPAIKLTAAEQEVVKLVRLGKTNWEIAKILNKSEYTVKTQLANIYSKTGVLNRTQLSQLRVL
jgi:DNA-binding CsgD family transcriptional regulator